MPPMMYSTSHAFAHRRARCAPCATPCSVPAMFKLLIAAIFFGPLIAPVFKLFFCLTSIFLFYVAPLALITMLMLDVLPSTPCDIARCMKMKKCTRGPTNKTVREQHEAKDGDDDSDTPIRVDVVAPGVAPSDIKVTVLENTIKIEGKTKRGDSIFAVDKHVVAPRLADTDTAECTHADGIVTITMRRKAIKRIPVQVERVAEGEPVSDNAPERTEIPSAAA